MLAIVWLFPNSFDQKFLCVLHIKLCIIGRYDDKGHGELSFDGFKQGVLGYKGFSTAVPTTKEFEAAFVGRSKV